MQNLNTWVANGCINAFDTHLTIPRYYVKVALALEGEKVKYSSRSILYYNGEFIYDKERHYNYKVITNLDGYYSRQIIKARFSNMYTRIDKLLQCHDDFIINTSFFKSQVFDSSKSYIRQHRWDFDKVMFFKKKQISNYNNELLRQAFAKICIKHMSSDNFKPSYQIDGTIIALDTQQKMRDIAKVKYEGRIFSPYGKRDKVPFEELDIKEC